MRFRFRYFIGLVHTEVRLFCGPSSPVDHTLGRCGSFVMRNEEWTAFKEFLECYLPNDGLDGHQVEFKPEII